MEMPTGYERWKCSELRAPSHINDHEMALWIMKEMADALHQIRNLTDAAQAKAEINASVATLDEDDLYSGTGFPRDIADSVLKKFNEWD